MIRFIRWFFYPACIAAALSVPAVAEEAPPCEQLVAQLDGGAPPGDAVRATMETGFTLSEAAVYTLVCGGEPYRVDVATASVMLSGNMAQAQSVASALLRTAGQTGPVAVAVDHALTEYARGIPQPGVHQDVYTPHGGGVSPAS